MERFREWIKNGTAYIEMNHAKPLTLSVGLHDSPTGCLAWIADKIIDWSDSFLEIQKGTDGGIRNLSPGHSSIISGTRNQRDLFRYMLRTDLNKEGASREAVGGKSVEVPTGMSALWWENEMVPRKWAERDAKVIWWREPQRGGRCTVYEMPEEMVADIPDFVDSLGIREKI